MLCELEALYKAQTRGEETHLVANFPAQNVSKKEGNIWTQAVCLKSLPTFHQAAPTSLTNI